MAARETDNPQIRLASSGQLAVIEADRWVPGSFQLVVDGTPQSHVNLDDPTNLFFEYIQRIGHVIDLIGDPGEARRMGDAARNRAVTSFSSRATDRAVGALYDEVTGRGAR